MTKSRKIALASALLLLTSFLLVWSHDDERQPPASPSPSAADMPSPSPMVPVVSAIPSTTVSPAVRPSVAPVSVKSEVLTAINKHRSDAGVAGLTTQNTLAALAQAHASDMAAKGYFSHDSPSGVTFQQRIASSGYGGTAFAENIGLTSFHAVEIVAGWMNSEGHRTNMLNGVYHRVGIGVTTGQYQGRTVVFVVAVFGDK